MSVLQTIETALHDVGLAVQAGQYPDTGDPCGKIVFTNKDKSVNFFGGKAIDVETFKVVIRGNSYATLESKAKIIKIALRNAGFMQIGGYEDIEPKEDENFMQLAVNFKLIKQN